MDPSFPSSECKTVVVLERHDEDRQLLQQVILDYGLSLIRATNPEFILKQVQKEPVAALVVDLESAAPDALGFLRKLHGQFPDLPLIVLVDDASRESGVESLRLGAFATLRKPLQIDEVVYTLGRAVATLSEQYDATRMACEQRMIRMGNDFGLVTPVAKSIAETSLPLSEPRRYQVIIGLIEIINNAIEHGNLGIGYEEKRDALQGSFFYKLAVDRASREPWRDRRITITATIDGPRRQVRFEVEDEGDGFDWRNLPDPKDRSNIHQRHGRGILMARHSFDEFWFNDRGNKATMVLNLTPHPGAE